MYETAPAEPKRAAVPMTPAIPISALRPSRAERFTRIAIAVVLLGALIATLIMTGSSRESISVIEPPAAAAQPIEPIEPIETIEPAPPPPTPPAPAPEVQAELTPRDVKRRIFQITKKLRALDQSAVPKEKLGPIWRDMLEVRKLFESPDPDLASVMKGLDEVEAEADALEQP